MASGHLQSVPVVGRRPRGAPIERRVGRLLRLMRDHQLYRSLGFVRLADYVLERVGFSYRTALELIRADETLEGLPLAAAAFHAGEITAGHVRLLSRVAARESEAFWVGLARRTGVRGLARAVAAARREDDNFDAGDDPPAGASPESLPIPAPAWIAGLWRDTVSLVRCLAGTDLSPGACFEMVLAEVAADVGVESEAVGDSLTPAPCASLDDDSAESRETGGEAAGGRPINRKASVAPSELPPSAPTVLAECATTGAQRERGGARDTADIPDARAVDAELRRLAVERQRHEAALAEHLRLVAIDRGYRDAGFTSLEDYAADRFGLAPRSLYHLLALGRILRGLPALRRAFLAGRVTARQSSLIGGVATSLTVGAWVRHAERVTLRRLEDEVNFWVHLKETRPRVWDLLDGGPLPEGLVLAPGQPARLHSSALRRKESPQAGEGPAISAAALLHALEEDECATPLPARLCCIRLRVEPGVSQMWRATLRHLRATVREDLAPWEALALVLREFLSVWDNSETRRQQRENPIVERDGWRCTAPGCRSVGTGRLHRHHIVFRSAGGTDDDPSLLTTLCSGHHLGLLHEGKLRCAGRAPGNLAWELGVEPGRRPFLVFRGETMIAGAAG